MPDLGGRTSGELSGNIFAWPPGPGTPADVTVVVEALDANDTGDNVLLTDSFTIEVIRAVAPDGVFQERAHVGHVTSGKGVWDLSGLYSFTVAGRQVTMELQHDPRGRLSGTATCALARNTTIALPIRGRIRGAGTNTTIKLALRGADVAEATSASLTLKLALDTAHRCA